MHVIREVAAEFERPVLLFSGGKDSIVMLHLAEKAFWPAAVPFPVMHVDTGHNFPEVHRVPRPRGRRARRAPDRGVGAGRRSTAAGSSRRPARAPAATGCRPSRCSTRSPSTASTPSSAAARRDEEKARAKERVFSLPRRVRPVGPEEPAARAVVLYNGRHRKGEHLRVFPLSNWTELDVWQYIADEQHRAAVDLLRPPPRGVRARRHAAGRHAVHPPLARRGGLEDDGALPHRGRHDLHRRGRVGRRRRSSEVIAEVAARRITERGATRADDRFSEAAMEDRKQEGYF